jgi:hypothetical protein
LYTFLYAQHRLSVLQKEIPIGGTVASISIFTDETHLTNFSGNKKVKPVYVTINNIEKGFRRQKSSQAHILLGYIPVPKYSGFTPSRVKHARQQFFHDCMRRIVQPLVEAGKSGVDMVCADGLVRRVFPILACYVADAPEQALVTCTMENYCLKCTVRPNDRDKQLYPDHTGRIPLRKPERTKRILKSARTLKTKSAPFKNEGLRANCPFWEDLPHTNIFMSITPDILHQLHNGLIGEHLIPWLQAIISEDNEDELDNRFRVLYPHSGLRRFRDGISVISQWSGNERRALEKNILGIIIDVVPHRVYLATEALLTLVYYMRMESHDDTSLDAIYRALDTFHENKDAFVELGLRSHFNFPKLHAIQHYVDSIRLFGSADGYNTEIGERLHIDFAKMAYRATNHRDYIVQMTRWLERREKMNFYSAYQAWFDAKDARVRGLAPARDDVAASLHQQPEDTKLLGLRITGPNGEYLVSKTPGRKHVPISTLVNDSPGGYHAVQFQDALEDYLHATAPPGVRVPDISVEDKVDVYVQMTALVPGNPQTGRKLERDRIRAVPAILDSTGETSSPEAFSTVLVRDEKDNPNTTGTPLAHTRVARVRTLFELPGHLHLSEDAPRRLAYVEWFTGFSKPDRHSHFRAVKPSWRSAVGRIRRVDIVPLDRIVRCAYLLPAFGRSCDTSWNDENILDECPKFNLNPWITPRTWSQLSN